MSKCRHFHQLLPCAAVLLVALSIAGSRQSPTPKSAARDSSCLYDPEQGVIADCIHRAANGQLLITQHVLKQLQFDSQGLAAVSSEANGWMYVSRTGKVIITGVPTMDNWADTFHDGLIRVVRDGKYGFSNRKGQLVIPTVYDGAMNFENGKAKVCNGCSNKCAVPDCEYYVFSGGEWFEINTKGAIILRSIQVEN